MDRHWIAAIPQMIVLVAGLAAAGCQTHDLSDRDLPAVGEVNPRPAGCIWMEFFSPSDDSRVMRGPSGQVVDVITPTDRKEPLRRRWSIAEFETAVHRPHPTSQDDLAIPGTEAWEHVKRFMKPGDELWTFGLFDTGFVVFRQSNLWCMVVTQHQM